MTLQNNFSLARNVHWTCSQSPAMHLTLAVSYWCMLMSMQWQCAGVAQMDEHNRKIIFWLADDIADSPNLDRINVTDHKAVILIPDSWFLIWTRDQASDKVQADPIHWFNGARGLGILSVVDGSHWRFCGEREITVRQSLVATSQ